jgi:hypothetical protein
MKGGRHRRVRKDTTQRDFPKLRRLPVHKRRPRHVGYYMARFYGAYEPFGKTVIKMYGYQVLIQESMDGRMVRKCIALHQKKLRSNMIPIHRHGQTFRSFGELFQRTDWIRVKRVKVNRPKMTYPKGRRR